MKKSRFTEEKIIEILRQHAAGGKTGEVCRQHGISEATLIVTDADLDVVRAAAVAQATSRHAAKIGSRLRRAIKNAGANKTSGTKPLARTDRPSNAPLTYPCERRVSKMAISIAAVNAADIGRSVSAVKL